MALDSSGEPSRESPRQSPHESHWARRLRAERERTRRRTERFEEPPTTDLDPLAYDQPTADVDPDAPRPQQTFAAGTEPRSIPAPPVVHAAPSTSARVERIEPRPSAAPAEVCRVDASPLASPPKTALAQSAAASSLADVAPAAAATAPEPLPRSAVREISTGSLLNDRYLLGRVLGSGGGSLIFQAEDRRRIGAQDFGSKIAIKVLRPEMRHNSHALTRLKREFRQMQRLTHAGVARVFELACDEDIWFMTMELIDGQTINQWLKSAANRSAAMQIIAGCSEALSHAHEAGIVHGDLKPSNVLVLANGGVKLVDFGSAAERDAATGEIDKERSFAATPPYASPQVLAGEIADPRDDVFSLACLAYAILTHGEHPFDRKSSAEARQANMKPAYSRALLPRQFEVIVRGLAWDREHRPATAREFWHTLLASDLRREPGGNAAVLDGSSRPIPTTPTRDTPTIAAGKNESRVDAESQLQPAAAAAANASPPAQPQRETIKPEDIARLKAAVAAAEAHAQDIDPHRPQEEKRAVDPTKFRGYVAGPKAQREEDEGDAAASSALAAEAPRPQDPPKTAKRVWPWQRSAGAIVIAIAAALAIVATQLGSQSESSPSARALPAARSPAPAPPATPVAQTSAPTPAPVTQAEEKKSPQVAVKKPPPVAPAEVSFATRTLHVGVSQTMAALSVKRLHSTRGRARVAWTIEGGTARAGIDYQISQTPVIEFLEGQSVRSLFIPLVPEKDVGEARTSKTFTVKLQPISGGPKLGEINKVYVTIVGDVADERVAQADAG